MVWVLMSALSAALLGVYDILKKWSLKDNAVIPVLLISTITSALIFTPFVIYSTLYPDHHFIIKMVQVPWSAHAQFMLKSVIVLTSWIMAYFAMKNLPLTIVSPIRSSGPLWTIIGALVLFGERLNYWQWIGVTVTLLFYYLFSLSGLKEGISFRKNKWIMYMTISTIVGSISSLWDKYLVAHYDRITMQAWYHIYMVPLMFIIFLLFWYPKRAQYAKFQWRYIIPLIGICLTIADFIYFWALAKPGALVAIVSTVRRASVLVSFTLGAVIFKEKNIRTKGLILIGILAGIALIIMGG